MALNIEKMEQLAASTFESQFFSIGVIVCTDLYNSS